MGRPRHHPILTLIVAALFVLLAACSDDGGDDGASGDGGNDTDPSSSQPQEPEELRVLVTNDDGVAAAGIDALVTALEEEPALEVIVIAPAGDRSGTGGNTTPGSPGSLAVTDTTTASGHEAVAVEGFPADTVLHALATLDNPPDVVISGVNAGQNLGGLTEVSGTVGAARQAAREGVPGIAVSQGIGEPPDYESGVDAAIDWLREHRDELGGDDAAVTLVNINVPTCTAGEIRGALDVPAATTTDNAIGTVDCASTIEDPPDDITAFNNGYTTISELSV